MRKRWSQPHITRSNEQLSWKEVHEMRALQTELTLEQVAIKYDIPAGIVMAIWANVIRKINVTNMPEYHAWINMRQRCYYENTKFWKYYGGRGIKVCSQWLESFWMFYHDVGPKPEDGDYWLDRINNNGDYEPGNVRWATPIEQQNNRRNNVRAVK